MTTLVRERRRGVPDSQQAPFFTAVLQDVPLLAFVTLFAICGFASHELLGIPSQIRWIASWSLFGFFSTLYLAVAAIVLLVHTVVARKESLRQRRTWRLFARRLIRPRMLLNSLVILAALSILMQVFIAYKRSIPLIQPFSWDPAFMSIDRWLHFGYHPFELLQVVLGRPVVTKAIDLAYFFWIHVMWLTLTWQVWHGSNRDVRSRYLLSFVACWILLGTVAATTLSSAGPIYFGFVATEPNPYAPLLQYLQSVDQVHPLRVLFISDFLWTAYVNPEEVAMGGISAMPSLHIAIAVLHTLLGFSVNRLLGWLYATFAVLIFLGSIHLAWHYAIDGYVSALAVLGIWWAAGRTVRWWHDRIEGVRGVDA